MPLRYNEPTERVLGTKKKRKMKILSLFDGISCGMVALQRAGIEVERLQTLPDGYTECDGVSYSQRVEAIGNGWTVDVIAHILRELKK